MQIVFPVFRRSAAVVRLRSRPAGIAEGFPGQPIPFAFSVSVHSAEPRLGVGSQGVQIGVLRFAADGGQMPAHVFTQSLRLIPGDGRGNVIIRASPKGAACSRRRRRGGHGVEAQHHRGDGGIPGDRTHTGSGGNTVVRIPVFRTDVLQLVPGAHGELLIIISPAVRHRRAVDIHVEEAYAGDSFAICPVHVGTDVQTGAGADGELRPSALYLIAVGPGDDESLVIPVGYVLEGRRCNVRADGGGVSDVRPSPGLLQKVSVVARLVFHVVPGKRHGGAADAHRRRGRGNGIVADVEIGGDQRFRRPGEVCRGNDVAIAAHRKIAELDGAVHPVGPDVVAFRVRIVNIF